MKEITRIDLVQVTTVCREGDDDAIRRNDAFRNLFRLGFEFARNHPEYKYFDEIDWDMVREVW